eukprot:gene26595-18377_t
MRHTVQRYIRTCASCQQVKANTQVPNGLLQPLPIPDSRFDTWSMAFAFGLPMTKNKKDNMMVLQCSITKILIIIPCRTTITAPQGARLLLFQLLRTLSAFRLLSWQKPESTFNVLVIGTQPMPTGTAVPASSRQETWFYWHWTNPPNSSPDLRDHTSF